MRKDRKKNNYAKLPFYLCAYHELPLSLSKNCRTDAYYRSTFLDGNLIVPTHAHGKLAKLKAGVILLEFITKIPQCDERFSDKGSIACERSHGHKAPWADVRDGAL